MKKLLPILLSISLILSLSACRKNGKDFSMTSSDLESFISSNTSIPEPEVPVLNDEETTQSSKTDKKKPVNDSAKVTTETIVEPVTEKVEAKSIFSPSASEVATDDAIPPESVNDKNYKGFDYKSNQKHTAIGKNDLYYYSTLNTDDKRIYDAIDSAVKNFEHQVNIGTELKNSGKSNIYYLYMFDHPECFYLCNRLGIFAYEGKEQEQGLLLFYSYERGSSSNGKELSGSFKSALNSKIATFNNEVNRIVSTIPSDAPDAVKEKMIYDYLIQHCSYNVESNGLWDDFAEDNWTAYGGIINKKGTCEAYSKAFQLLCNKVGISCTFLSHESENTRHKWNAVKLDGEWYACDLTFDDPIGNEQTKLNHVYFNRTTAEMNGLSHLGVLSVFPYPDCTGTKYSYVNYFK